MNFALLFSLFVLLHLAIKLAVTQMGTHYVYLLEFPPHWRPLKTALIVIFLFGRGRKWQPRERFEGDDVFEALIDGVAKSFVPYFCGSDAVAEWEGLEGEPIVDF